MSQKTLTVHGMHCASCEQLLERALEDIDGMTAVTASSRKQTVALTYEGRFPKKEVARCISEAGYTLVPNQHQNQHQNQHHNKQEKGKKSSSQSPAPAHQHKANHGETLFWFIFTLILGLMVYQIDLSRFFPGLENTASVAVAFGIGIIASLSSCLATVGGVVMSFASTYPVQTDARHPFFHRLLPHLYFHLGRFTAFLVLGGVLGLVGQQVALSPQVSAFLSIFVALLLVYLGLHILGLVPSPARFGFHLPKAWSRGLHKLEQQEHPLLPAVLGAGTFILPCGFTQSMQIAALGTGNVLQGALLLGAFTLGTLPVLLAVGVGASFAQGRSFPTVQKIVGSVVLLFGLFSLNSGLTLAGIPLTFQNVRPASTDVITATQQGNVQVVHMDVDYTFKPNEFVIKKDVPVRWEINGKNITGCSNEVIIPSLNVTSGKLNKGLNVVEFTPTQEGFLPFSCWMGMIDGRFIVQ